MLSSTLFFSASSASMAAWEHDCKEDGVFRGNAGKQS